MIIVLISVLPYTNILTYVEDHCMYNEYSSITKNEKSTIPSHSY